MKEEKVLLFFSQALYFFHSPPVAVTALLFRAHEAVLGWGWRTRFLALLHYAAHAHICRCRFTAFFLLLLFATEQQPSTRLYLTVCFRNMLLAILEPYTKFDVDWETGIFFLALFIEAHRF